MMSDRFGEKSKITKGECAGWAALLGLVCALTFFNSLHNGFMMDDHYQVLQESSHHHLKFWKDFFIPHSNLSDKTQALEMYYRPLAHIPHTIAYIFFKNDPFGYHVVNLVLFYLSALVVFLLARMVLADITAAFLTALFYVIHPVNGLMVNYITANVYSLQVIFMSGGLLAAIAWSENIRQKAWLAFALILFVLALMCHETSLAFPFYLAAVLYIARRKTFADSWRCVWPFALAAGMYLVWRIFFVSLKVSVLNKISHGDVSILEYLATFPFLVLWYVKALVTGQGIVLIWTQPIVKNVAVGLGAGLAFLAGFVFLIRRWGRTPKALGLWLFALSFLPVTLACFFQISYGLMIEPHWVVMGGIGFFMVISCVLMKLRTKMSFYLWVILVATLTAWGVKTSWTYNHIWSDEVRYCLFWQQQAPAYRPPLFYLAGAYERKGDVAEAESIYLKALEGKITDHEIYNNLGLLALNADDPEKARTFFLKSLDIYPDSAAALTNLAAIEMNAGNLDAAKTHLERAIAVNPFLIEPRLNLAGILNKQGQTAEAIRLYQDNEAIDPTDDRSLWELMLIYEAVDQKENFVAMAERFLRISSDAKRLTQAGSLLAQHGFLGLAIRCFEKVFKSHPEYKDVYAEAGKVLGNINDLDGAIQIWQDGQKKFPQDKVFMELIEQAKYLKAGSGGESFEK